MIRPCILPLLLAAGIAACSHASSKAAQPVALDAAVTLAPGSAAALRDDGVEVQFVAVAEDSRCPVDTTCVWAGQVNVRLRIRGRSARAMHTVLEGGDVAVDGYRVTVMEVLPKPVSSRRIAPEEYRVTLKISKSG